MDKTLVCRECGVSFTFTQGEQEFYESRGLANPPSRCPKCRAVRRAQMNPTTFQPGQSSAPGATLTPRPFEARQMYPATCGRCGQPTQVPFQPRGDRPVFCSTCFHAERASSPTPSFRPSPAFASVTPEQSSPEEGRRERRAPRRREEPKAERAERLQPYHRERTFIEYDEDEDYEE